MPIYEYHCESCDHQFELLLDVSKRGNPLSESCPCCEATTIKKGISIPITGANANLTADKVCPGFSRRLEEISKGPTINREAKRNLMAAASLRPSGHLRPR